MIGTTNVLYWLLKTNFILKTEYLNGAVVLFWNVYCNNQFESRDHFFFFQLCYSTSPWNWLQELLRLQCPFYAINEIADLLPDLTNQRSKLYAHLVAICFSTLIWHICEEGNA